MKQYPVPSASRHVRIDCVSGFAGIVAGLVAVFLTLAALAEPGWATNRCVTPAGKTLYTDVSCESAGAKLQGEVRTTISVVPGPSMPAGGAKPAAGKDVQPPKKVFQKSPNSPLLSVCYDPKDARGDVSLRDVESAIGSAVAQWNAGCNVNYQFMGTCPAEIDRTARPIDYKVWWATWDDSLTIDRDGVNTAREHAIAAASPRIGVSLNRTIDRTKFLPQYRRSITHEFGHVVGVGHSPNRDDVMFSGGRNGTLTASDLAACNAAVEARFGVK